MTSASCCCFCWCFGYVNKIKWWKMCSPRSTILPKRFLPRRKLRVEQFHRRFLNWCWHSAIAIFAPFAIAARTPGFSRASRRCFRRRVAWIAGSMYTWTGVTGEMLFGSPAFAMPLKSSKKWVKSLRDGWIQTKTSFYNREHETVSGPFRHGKQTKGESGWWLVIVWMKPKSIFTYFTASVKEKSFCVQH